ncbi:splicing factor Cactin-like [Argiope bruennichi]|uniref:splicing factor Cactin-like n=1 Tax=Argiope bruennichi TaxID=94029 RepID=UPI0024944F8F|nr:splicing factor Cactin-like [Argiope bruennichi]
MSHKKHSHDKDSHHEKKHDKKLLKSLETPEEKRLRRFMKKEQKQRKLKEEMGWDDEYMGYTNTDNPFGDTNLLNGFVWKKKLEKEGLHKLSKEEMERRNRLKLEQNKNELEKVKLRRMQREREREMREEELTRIQRQKEAAQFSEWEKQEDSFHLQQAKLRSKIRIEEGRAKPIDLLARYISSEEEDFNIEMHEPYKYLNGLKREDLEDLQEDIKVYKSIENGKNYDYWKDLEIIVDDEIRKLSDNSDSHRESINTAVSTEIVSIFKGKTPKQLEAMYRQIKKKTTEEGVDTGYWETLLSRLNAYMARARLAERHEENLRNKLFKLKEEQGVQQAAPLFPCVSGNKLSSDTPSTSSDNQLSSDIPSTSSGSKSSETPSTSSEFLLNSNSNEITIKQEPIDETVPDVNEPGPSSKNSENNQNATEVTASEKPAETVKHTVEVYDSGRYSPVLIKYSKIEPGIILTDPLEDSAKLEYMQQSLTKRQTADFSTPEEKAFEQIARKGMDSDEAVFSVEHALEKSYIWADKYRPRKPRYFNRVHTGFEWNKYNQTHYDIENPPPKIVQGYKFNIFYPDLIDKTKTPEYSLSPCEDNKDFAILKFKAGPPYETIAFKIVNREWEYSYKRGFRCQFHNNIFQLYFHFKRYRYRR